MDMTELLAGSTEVPISDETPEQLDARLGNLRQEILRRKTAVIDPLKITLGDSKAVEIKGVSPDALGERTKSILEAVGVNTEDLSNAHCKISVPVNNPNLELSLKWIPKSNDDVSEIKISINDDPNDSDVVVISLNAGLSRLGYFSSLRGDQIWGENIRTNLVQTYGKEKGSNVFQSLSTPFARLALAQELASIPSKSTQK